MSSAGLKLHLLSLPFLHLHSRSILVPQTTRWFHPAQPQDQIEAHKTPKVMFSETTVPP